MRRRGLIGGALAAGLLAGRGAAQDLPVLVIGAGAAGLAAAQALRQAGQAALVLEARGRIGGRVATSRAWPDAPVELGAGWVHGVRGNPLTALAAQAGVALHPQGMAQALRDRAGRRRDDLEPLLARAADLVAAARARAEGWARDAPLSAAVARHPAWSAADAELRAAVRFLVETEIEQEFGADWTDLSAWWFDAAGDLPGGDARPLAGYDRLLAPLAAGLDLRLGARVLRLRAAPGGVVAELAGGGQVAGRAAVVTLPLGVLKAGAVAFDPPLAAPRQRAIERLGMGLLTKLVLRFERRFWDAGADWLGLWGAAHAAWVDATAPGGPPVLLGLRAGAAAAADERLAPHDRAAAALADLRAAFGAAVPAPLAVQASRWHDDPFARGAYSFHPPGSTPDDRAALAGADWDGRLAFAGEAASPDHPATVHGAVLSGRAAAAALA